MGKNQVQLIEWEWHCAQVGVVDWEVVVVVVAGLLSGSHLIFLARHESL
jgi:hypothetical protein